MPFNCVGSASLDLIQPTFWDSEAGHYLNNWGPGLYYIRIGVNNLEAKAEDLRKRDVSFSIVDSSEAVGGKSLLKVDPSELRGQMFEFEEI